MFAHIDPDCVSSCSGGYNNKDHDDEDWALWGENKHDFCTIPLRASSG
jgi:hypothetical protein